MITSPDIVVWITSIFLFFASYFDLKTGEIPEKITRGLIVAVIVLAAISSFNTLGYYFMFWSLAVGTGFFVVGYVMFYLGEWGGGDVKLLAGIGCSLGLLNALGYFTPQGAFSYPVDYFINFATAAPPYAILYSLFLGLMKPAVFEEFIKSLTNRAYLALVLFSFLLSFIVSNLGTQRLTFIYVLIPLLVLVSLYLKAVERIALQKSIPLSELREADILAYDLVIDDRKIASRRDIEGITKEQLGEIRSLAAEGNIPEKISIRWGIRFAPVFFIAFLMTFFYGNVLELIVLSLML
ncbi:MAG: prepilin peptidase [Candidatus Altiarchaeota archaeon]|nr:prepilin peptidase [Candidatus Altiarchaeota archaeon]